MRRLLTHLNTRPIPPANKKKQKMIRLSGSLRPHHMPIVLAASSKFVTLDVHLILSRENLSNVPFVLVLTARYLRDAEKLAQMLA